MTYKKGWLSFGSGDENMKNGKLKYVKLFFFAFLFLSALSLAACVALPLRVTETAQSVADGLPYALPTLRIESNEMFDAADITELSAHGDEAILYSRELLYTTRSAEELSDLAALYTVDAARAGGFYTLREGRMPQNAGECVVSKARGLFYEIGDTLVLWMNDTPIYSLTVVGIADDVDSMLSAFADEEAMTLVPALHIYRPKTDDVGALSKAANYIAAIPNANDVKKTADDLALYVKAKQEGQSQTTFTPDEDAIRFAQESLNDAQIKRMRIENQITSLDAAATEAETAYLKASAELEAERQEFVSNMERHEAVRANQTHLITRKEAAEEAFAKKQAEIDQIYQNLTDIYAERDALRHAHAEAEQIALEAEQTLKKLKTGEPSNEQSALIAEWIVTMPRDSEAGDLMYTALLHADKSLSGGFLAAAVFCILLTVASVLFWRGKWGAGEVLSVKKGTSDIITLVLYTLFTACSGVALGGFVLPQWKFGGAYPTFDGALAQPASVFGALATVAVLLSAAFVLLNMFGAQLLERVIASASEQSASSDGE